MELGIFEFRQQVKTHNQRIVKILKLTLEKLQNQYGELPNNCQNSDSIL